MKNIPLRKINTFLAEPAITESFSIRDIKALLSEHDLIQDHHRHDFFFVMAISTGEGEHEIDFTPYKISDNSIFLMRPGQVHRLKLKAGSKGYLMQFKTDFYQPHSNSTFQQFNLAYTKNYCQLDQHEQSKLFNILEYILEEFSNKKESYQEVIKANLDVFYIEFVRHRKRINPDKNNSNLYKQEQLEKFMSLLEKNVYNCKKVSQYAKMMNFTSYQLNSITKETLNKTCSDLINEHIILESKRYLLATSNQVNQIAYSLGYEDVSYFIRFFKKHTGQTPEGFRNKFK